MIRGRMRSVLVVAVCLTLSWIAVPASRASAAKRVVVLGVDGLDPVLLRHFIDEGKLPNFQKMIASGDFKPLQTSMPPLSPIAWSTFITGMDPGGHGIYDFIHRDPATLMPYLSMSRVEAAKGKVLGFLPPVVPVRSWCIPLAGGSVENLRRGTAFWQLLEDRGVPTTVFRMPANFPPVETGGKAFSGMGTPDITGTSGTFSYYSDLRPPNADDFTGGEYYPITVTGNRVQAQLHGPKDPVRCEAVERRGKTEYKNPEMTVDFTVYLDPERKVAKFEVQDTEFILKEGEWSPWVRVDFTAVPLLASVSAIGRFYLQEIRPDFRLYVTPLQINPEDPALPIATPESWSHELYQALGYFYTQELPEDTKAFTNGVFTGHEFWNQAQLVFGERRRALDYFLDRFEEGLLFFYFSSVDQNSHMLWQYMDPAHPAYTEDETLMNGIRTVYAEIDEALGRVMGAIGDDTTLIVMSDHGFCPFYRGVNLNTWLLDKGYVKLRDPSAQGKYPFFANVDWTGTQAYALGLNGLYVNLRGRETRGIVNEGADYDALLDRIERDLLELKDPENGQNAVTLVVRPRRDFHGPYADKGPDIVVGYNKDYRSSWKSPLGEFPKQVFVDNKDAWSGDHSVDYRHVPGVLIANRKITLDSPALYDLTVAILDEYGLPKGEGMIGQDCLGDAAPGSK